MSGVRYRATTRRIMRDLFGVRCVVWVGARGGKKIPYQDLELFA